MIIKQYRVIIVACNEKQYAYVAGFQGTIVSKLHKCFFLAQSFNLPQKPAIIAYCMLYTFIFQYINHFTVNFINPIATILKTVCY